MNVARCLSPLVVFTLLTLVTPARACTYSPSLDRLNRRLAGHIVDHTDHHGADRRIWSTALCRPRNMYVHLPPGYCPDRQYPCMVWMHGLNQDERDYLTVLAERFDAAMASGCLPPIIIAIPDGSICESNGFLHLGSFYINTDAGRFEDYLSQDVWPFLLANYSIRPERDAHVLVGASMGGFGAYNFGFKHREQFGVIAGIHPALNLRWVDCHGNYRTHFDPECWGWRELVRRHEVMARFLLIIPVRMSRLVDPLFTRSDEEIIAALSLENPAEMLGRLGIRSGEFKLFIGYGELDQFNVAAQVESFMELATKQNHLDVEICYLPRGRHDTRSALMMFPQFIHWLAPIIAPYSPGPTVAAAE